MKHQKAVRRTSMCFVLYIDLGLQLGAYCPKDPGTEFLEFSALAANDLYDGMAHSAGAVPIGSFAGI